MTDTSLKPSRRNWISENSIPVRIGSPSAILLADLILSAMAVAYDLVRNQNCIKDANNGFHRLEVAAQADRHFGEMRLWMSDSAVSQLTLSERHEQEARVKFEESLDQVAEFGQYSRAPCGTRLRARNCSLSIVYPACKGVLQRTESRWQSG